MALFKCHRVLNFNLFSYILYLRGEISASLIFLHHDIRKRPPGRRQIIKKRGIINKT